MRNVRWIVGLAAVLVGCGGGGDGGTAPPPPPPTVAVVEVTPSTGTVEVGQSLQLAAQAKDASGNALSRSITWSSADPSKASVDGTGRVTGVAETAAVTVTASADGKSGTATILVKPASVASVSVALAATTIQPGGTTSASVVLRDAAGNTLAGRAVAWTTSNAAVATIDASGKVTGVAPGQVDVIATSEGKTGSVALTVVPPPVASITLRPDAAWLNVGESGQYQAELRDAAGNLIVGRPIAWASSAPSVATVSNNGTVTGVSAGSATITATSEGKSANASLTVVLPPPPVASITLEPSPAQIYVGQSGFFVVTLRDASGAVLTDRPIAWSSSAPAIATVAANGLVSAIAVGTTTITATSEGKSTSAPLIVRANPSAVAAVASVSLSPAQAQLYVGDGGYFTLTLRDAAGNVLTGRVVTWSSSAPAVASVATDGLVVGLSAGTATISATSEGKVGTATVTVSTQPVYSPSVCTQIGGGRVIASDGVFIGSLTNKFNAESVLNEYGQYGGRYSAKSIYNPYGDYGSKYSAKSPYNPYTSTPPRIVFSDGTYLWLTVNTTFAAGTKVSPDFIKTCTNFP